MIRAAIYARISKTEDKRDKPADQVADCRRLAEREGYEVISTFVDDGISAYGGAQRPQFEQMCAAIADKQFDVIVATYEDRLSRQPLEKLELLALCADAGTDWHTVNDGKTKTATDEGELSAYLRGMFAKKDSAEKAKKIRDAKRIARESGQPTAGARMFGYQKGGKKLEPKEADLIRAGVDMLLSGAPRWDVVKLFNESGIPTVRGNTGWRPNGVYDVLRRARNAQLVEHEEPLPKSEQTMPGRVLRAKPEILEGVIGDWDPICSPDELAAVRAILRVPVKATSGKPPVTLLSGIAKCHCGEVLHAHGASWAGTRVYRCASMDTTWDRNDFEGGHVAIKIALLDALIRARLVDLYVEGDAPSDLRSEQARLVSEIHVRLDSIRQEKEELHWQSKNGLDRQIWRRDNAALNAKEDALKKELETVVRDSAHARMVSDTRSALARSSISIGREIAQHLTSQDQKESDDWFEMMMLGSYFEEDWASEEEFHQSEQYGLYRAFMAPMDKREREQARADLAKRLEALPLDKQKTLIRASLSITVFPRRKGQERLAIVPI